ncbi:hypothetical protein AQUCO_11500010v1 [Aquilegia coerulea]|uniref:Uncharacterized protein n=1 Tax=Aquilegia coerulea TaxID=218851 RepID=A0A2G5C2A5_AQUCA|nr:hypothetical protein AQUCO_11500010v1 [Aquilegia coerulea]
MPLWSAQYTANIRPSMSDIVMMLENKILICTPPYYPFHFGQSSSSSVLPSLLKVIPEVNQKRLLPLMKELGMLNLPTMKYLG